MTFMLEQLLSDGWKYHDTESERLARELEAAGTVGVPAALVASFIHLSTHTIGQHLRDWPRALALGRRVLQDRIPNAEAAKACERLYVAAVMAGDAIGAAELELRGLEAASNPLTSLLSMRLLLAEVLVDTGRVEEGSRLYRFALNMATEIEGVPDLERRIAATSNNIAWTLHDLPSRTAEGLDVMQLASAASVSAWQRCGDWINVQSALYLQASVARMAGDPEAALRFSTVGLDLIAANGKRPFDVARFYLLRAMSFTTLGEPEERARALDEAERAAADIAIADLRQQFATERARVGREGK
jgi:hypothetical protein